MTAINPFPWLKPGVFPGLILSGAYYPDLKIGVSRRERMKRSGFSLIEILVAMALALVLILGTAELITYSLKAKKKGDLASGLAHVTAARLETLKSSPFDGDELLPGDYSSVVLDDLSLEQFAQDWTIEEETAGMKRVLIMTRSLDYPKSELRLILYISRALGFRP